MSLNDLLEQGIIFQGELLIITAWDENGDEKERCLFIDEIENDAFLSKYYDYKITHIYTRDDNTLYVDIRENF